MVVTQGPRLGNCICYSNVPEYSMLRQLAFNCEPWGS